VVTNDALVLVGDDLVHCAAGHVQAALASSWLMLWLEPIRPVRWSGLGLLGRCLGPCLLSLRQERVWYGDEADMAKLQPEHHPGRAVLSGLDWSARDPVVYLGQRPAGTQPAAGATAMENTATAILTGLGTMLVAAAALAGLVWLAYRLADRS
jgi:hypothetical protein